MMSLNDCPGTVKTFAAVRNIPVERKARGHLPKLSARSSRAPRSGQDSKLAQTVESPRASRHERESPATCLVGPFRPTRGLVSRRDLDVLGAAIPANVSVRSAVGSQLGQDANVLRAVIFDFHNTIVRADSLSAWVAKAARAVGAPQAPSADIVPILRNVWSRAALRYPDTSWDLDPVLHRSTFEQILTEESSCSDVLAAALYDQMPSCWVAADGAVDLLGHLHASGVRLGLVSNIAIDIRPRLDALGLLRHFDTVVMSYQVGFVKPDVRIFEHVLANLDVSPTECLMVGDSISADGGATQAGISTMLIPVIDDRPQLSVVSRLTGAPVG